MRAPRPPMNTSLIRRPLSPPDGPIRWVPVRRVLARVHLPPFFGATSRHLASHPSICPALASPSFPSRFQAHQAPLHLTSHRQLLGRTLPRCTTLHPSAKPHPSSPPLVSAPSWAPPAPVPPGLALPMTSPAAHPAHPVLRTHAPAKPPPPPAPHHPQRVRPHLLRAGPHPGRPAPIPIHRKTDIRRWCWKT